MVGDPQRLPEPAAVEPLAIEAQRSSKSLGDARHLAQQNPAAVANIVRAEALMRRLRELGFDVALDDFGRGLSSLTYLKTLPATCLKIDGTFVRDVVDDDRSQAMLSAIVRLAQARNHAQHCKRRMAQRHARNLPQWRAERVGRAEHPAHGLLRSRTATR